MLLAQCQLYLINLSKNKKITTKIFGAALCLGIKVGAAEKVGVHLSFDILSFVVPDAGIVFLKNLIMGPAMALSRLIILFGFTIS